MGATELILIPNSALTMLSVSTPEAQTRHESGVSDRLGQTNRVDATAYRWLSIMRGGHSCVTRSQVSTVRGQGRATWIKKTASTLKTQVDAVVVGSGPGGATVTRELASHGWKLLILERGQRKTVTGTVWA